MNKKKDRSKLAQYSLVAAIAVILTFPSMIIIKDVPGNSFKTKWHFLATALVVFGVWFVLIGICSWFVKYITGSRKLKKNPLDKAAQKVVVEEKRNFSVLGKVLKWLIIIGVVYFAIVFTVMAIVFGSMAIH